MKPVAYISANVYINTLHNIVCFFFNTLLLAKNIFLLFYLLPCCRSVIFHSTSGTLFFFVYTQFTAAKDNKTVKKCEWISRGRRY